ncbi:MAG: LysM peptidoglycan-binding domain-containing protein [bacterium]|nr:LysM peptidoglycan-binding domain-containing protein [bacterium]
MLLRHLILFLMLAVAMIGCETLPEQADDSMLLTSRQEDRNAVNQSEDDLPDANPVEADPNGASQGAETNRREPPSDRQDLKGKDAQAHASREFDATDGQAETLLDEALAYCQVAQDLWQKGELENALATLDNAYGLILQVETSDHTRLMQQKEDLRFLISKRILEIYASRKVAIDGHYNAIPLVLNRHVQAELDRFTKGSEKRFFLEAYKRSGSYRPYILQALREAGLPEELSWMPLIESGFKVRALSRARALGLWQFIPSTGYKFGLKRDKYIDERLDPIKSTQAAIAYLKALHHIFGDWTTVLAAYNCGEGCVLRRIRSQNINYLDNFWDLYERLPRETARYVPRFLATLHIVSAPETYGLATVEMAPPLTFETLEINRQVHLKDMAAKTGIALKTLRALNPELRYGMLPREPYALRVPLGKSQILLAKLDEIPIASHPRRDYVWHRVRRGDSMSTIARRYRTTVGRIMRANNLRRSHYIVAGKKLRIPHNGTVISRRQPTARQGCAAGSIHVVKRGDSLWTLARHCGTTTRKIQELNHLRTTTLRIGLRLKIPGHRTEPINSSKLTTYYVKRGDSPYTIAQRHNMSLKQLLRLNQLTLRSTIYPGQKLVVE